MKKKIPPALSEEMRRRAKLGWEKQLKKYDQELSKSKEVHEPTRRD